MSRSTEEKDQTGSRALEVTSALPNVCRSLLHLYKAGRGLDQRLRLNQLFKQAV